ncbi:ATP-grasp domain-containing protein [Faecalicatena contorta]|uniref:Carbamoyl-phosphate synthase large subunit n=1 Tax=Faecalicatena contorta TaxID=39482 RepID=A0A315ZTI7_9FIRM|nr:ATP-grasp domain-containing protein [Faecalicatena contorta]PWJ48220.1 carbamoyl-phosphate synthase large subunit [Faecalicatena contorta]SUQ15496.1 carbamoyl-phosphate synthase large subunit [Faecalicatena contorta]
MQKKKYNILVTGVGAIIGYGILKSLKSLDCINTVVGMDIYADAVGQRWCNKFIQAKYAVDPNYIEFLMDVMNEHDIDIVFFGTEQEIYKVQVSRNQLGNYFQKMVINKEELLVLSKDKWKTYHFLLENELVKYAIPSVISGTYIEISNKFGVRFMLKPRSSYASKGIVIIENKEEFDFYKERMGDNFMAQPLIGDAEHEYTVGVFGLGDGTYSSKICMRRKLSQEGATSKAEVIFDERFDQTVNELVNKFKPIGPTNLQFRLHEGQYYLLEINPRISSSTSLRMAFSYNEAEMCIAYFLQNKISKPQVKRGLAYRYIDEVIEYL